MTPQEFLTLYVRHVADVRPEDLLEDLWQLAADRGFDLHELAPPPDGK